MHRSASTHSSAGKFKNKATIAYIRLFLQMYNILEIRVLTWEPEDLSSTKPKNENKPAQIFLNNMKVHSNT